MKYTLKALVTILSALVTLIFITHSCKKSDIVSPELQSQDFTEKFFTTKSTPDPQVAKIISVLKNENSRSGFVNKLPKNYGLPIWEKAGYSANTTMTNSFTDSVTAGDYMYIPTSIAGNGISSIIVAHEQADTIAIKLYTNDYLYRVCHEANLDTSQAENILALFFAMENYCFGTTVFYHIPPRLFKNSKEKDSAGNKIIRIKDMSNEQSSSSLIHCVTFYHCINSAPCNNWFCDRCGLCETTICHNEDTPPPGGGGGGGGGTGGGGGGNGGGGCSSCNPPPPPNCEEPFYLVDPCGPPPPDEPPTQEWIDLQWMNNNLKDSTNNSCVAGVLTTLKQINSKLPELLRSVFDTSTANAFSVTFKMENLGTYEGGRTIPNFQNFDYKVKVNSFFNNATELSVASTVIHEIFHCQILAWFRQCYTLGDTAKQRELVNEWGYLFTGEVSLDSNLAFIAQGQGPLQHQAIAVRYRDFIGQALFEFAQARGINVDLLYCKDLAWAGLTGDSRAFIEGFSDTEKYDINKKINAEKDPYASTVNDPFWQYKGTPCL